MFIHEEATGVQMGPFFTVGTVLGNAGLLVSLTFVHKMPTVLSHHADYAKALSLTFLNTH